MVASRSMLRTRLANCQCQSFQSRAGMSGKCFFRKLCVARARSLAWGEGRRTTDAVAPEGRRHREVRA